MKKKFILAMVVLMLFLNCEKKEELIQPIEVKEFLTSNDFRKYECIINSFGRFGVGQVIEQTILIPLYKESSSDLSGYLQVAKLSLGTLPNDEIYFMNLMVFNKWNNNNLTGEVKLIALNYGNLLHAKYKVDNNIIRSIEYYELPKEYQNQINKGYFADLLACYRVVADYYDSVDLLHYICDWTSSTCAAAGTIVCVLQMDTFREWRDQQK